MSSNIYKVYHNINNCFGIVYIFIGGFIIENAITINDINTLYTSNPKNSIFNNLFSDRELEMIKKCSTKIIFLEEQIYIDDTIETIKKNSCKIYQNQN